MPGSYAFSFRTVAGAVALLSCAVGVPATASDAAPDTAGLSDVCGAPISNVEVEEGHIPDFPAILAPDIGADRPGAPAEWTALDGTEEAITIHCTFADGTKKSVTLPRERSRCVVTGERMLCGPTAAD